MKKKVEEFKKPSLARGLYTLLFLVIGRGISILVCMVAIFQFVYSLIYSKPNDKVLEFTKSLSEFTKEIVVFVSFNSEEKPWPMGDWPKA